MIRQPIVSVLGHIDHGKTSLLDRIRGSAVVEREAGGITQHIGATEIPIGVVENICGGLLKQLNIKIILPGLLFIDTPGHEAFTTLRRRGGALADLAILVVDIMEGFQPQTYEALNILKIYKVPFLVAANKIDRIQGWEPFEGFPFTHAFSKQNDRAREVLEDKIYEMVGVLHEQDFQSERFDRVERFEKQVSIVPVSAKTGEGIPELLMILTGLAQKFLGTELEVEKEAPAKGTILEVKEERGLGITIDVIIYDGVIKKNNTIIVGGKRDIVVTKVRALLKPKPLDEIRDPKFRFDAVDKAYAACGIKIASPGLADALAGTPLRVVDEDIKKAEEEVRREIEEVKIETETAGVVIKADTLGSLEALINMLKQEEMSIRKADVGDVAKRDVIEAETVKEEDYTKAVILAFNVKTLKDAEERAKETSITIFQGNVIYKLIEDYKEWIIEEKEKERKRVFDRLIKPGKIQILPGYVFRQSKPAIVGIEVLAGTVKTNYKLMNKSGRMIGIVKGIQERNEDIGEAKKGRQVAMAIEGPTVGRQIKEEEILYTEIPESHAKMLETKYKDSLSSDENEAFEEIKKIKRKESPFWATTPLKVGGV
jgi:translation initiation factor 5B